MLFDAKCDTDNAGELLETPTKLGCRIPSDGVTLMGFDTLLQISLVIVILIFQTSVHLSNSPFLLTM